MLNTAVRPSTKGVCFDVFAWKDDHVLFCEAKQRAKDELRPTQPRWLDGAVALGIDAKSFLVVELSFRQTALAGASKRL